MRRLGGPALLRSRFLLGIVLVWTLVAFLPVVRNDFVNWDDPRMFLENPYHRQPWLARLRYAWSSHLLGEFMPVTWMSYSLDRSLWDLHAPGYHLTSLLLHVLATLAVFALARRFLRHALGADGRGRAAIDVGAAVAALVFAVHPLRVEPVAWVSARGTVLGGLLLVLSVLLYVMGWERGQRTGGVPSTWLAGSLALFVASILARATGLVLPAVLVVLDIYPLRRLGGQPTGQLTGSWGPAGRRAWAEKAGFAVIGALALPLGFLARARTSGTSTARAGTRCSRSPGPSTTSVRWTGRSPHSPGRWSSPQGRSGRTRVSGPRSGARAGRPRPRSTSNGVLRSGRRPPGALISRCPGRARPGPTVPDTLRARRRGGATTRDPEGSPCRSRRENAPSWRS